MWNVSLFCRRMTGRPAPATGTVRSTMARASANTAVVTPMPSASESTVTEGKDRAFAQRPHGVAQIPYEIFDEVYSAHVAALLLDLCDRADRAPRRMGSLVRRHTTHQVLCELLFEVEAKLVVELLIYSLAAQQ